MSYGTKPTQILKRVEAGEGSPQDIQAICKALRSSWLKETHLQEQLDSERSLRGLYETQAYSALVRQHRGDWQT